MTETDTENDLRAFRREYYASVKAAADDLREIEDDDDRQEALGQYVDGSEFVIYTWRAWRVMLVSDHPDAYRDFVGEPQDDLDNLVSLAAFWAMYHDVQDALDAA